MKKICLALLLLPFGLQAQEMYHFPTDGRETRWISFENQSGAKGKGAMENMGAKGHPCDTLKGGGTLTLADFHGAGVINRIWMTIINRSPEALRSIRIDIYWDGAATPAVSAPLGDFFGIGLGRRTAFQSALFTDPEGKSFNCYIPMPFKKHAKIILTNESKLVQLLFYDVNLTLVKKHPDNVMYFHAYWNSNARCKLGEDFEILPDVKGKGRYLGSNLGVIADKIYGDTWWGEGEVKIFMDGDKAHPTLAGTGTEDYIGTAWNLNAFSHLYQGCPIVDKEKKQYAFYRYHIPDPVYFHTGCRVTIQQMGGGGRDPLRALAKAGARLKAVTVNTPKGIIKLLEDTSFPDIFDDRFPKDEWVNFYRLDNYTATAYFYLDKPENGLPPLAPLAERLNGIR